MSRLFGVIRTAVRLSVPIALGMLAFFWSPIAAFASSAAVPPEALLAVAASSGGLDTAELIDLTPSFLDPLLAARLPREPWPTAERGQGTKAPPDGGSLLDLLVATDPDAGTAQTLVESLTVSAWSEVAMVADRLILVTQGGQAVGLSDLPRGKSVVHLEGRLNGRRNMTSLVVNGAITTLTQEPSSPLQAAVAAADAAPVVVILSSHNQGNPPGPPIDPPGCENVPPEGCPPPVGVPEPRGPLLWMALIVVLGGGGRLRLAARAG